MSGSTMRWREGGAPLSGMAEALETLGEQHADPEQVARLQTRLAPLLATPVDQGGTTMRAEAGRWTGVVSGSLGVLLVGSVLWLVMRPDAPQAPSVAAPAPVAPVAPAEPNPMPPHDATPIVTDEIPKPTAANDDSPSVAARASSKVGARPKAHTGVGEDTTNPEAELALLRAAQSALNRSASAALRTLNEHERLYPQGLFVQEREMLRIEAELTLGHREQALQRARRFSERFGASTYRTRIDTLISKPMPSKDRESETAEGTP